MATNWQFSARLNPIANETISAGSAESMFISEDLTMKVMSCLGAASVAAVTLVVNSIIPAIGAPVRLPTTQIPHPPEATYVRDGMGWRGNGGGGWRHGGNWHGGNWNRGNWHGGGWHGGGGWYNGYGGYGGYYGGDDFWIGGGALLLGALIGSAIANNNYHGNYGNYYYEDRYPQGYRSPVYRQRYPYSDAPYRHRTADPYLGWQRALDR